MDYEFGARVDRWVDGDTVDLLVSLWDWTFPIPFAPVLPASRHETDLGFRLWMTVEVGPSGVTLALRLKERFRLLGIDTPETNRIVSREAGKAAARYARELAPVGSRVLVRSSKAGKYGRWLGEIFTAEGSEGDLRNVNDELLKSGHAVVYGKR